MANNTQYNKLDDTKKQVDTVIDIMKDNINKVLQRDEKLGDMESPPIESSHIITFSIESHYINAFLIFKTM